MESRKSRKQAPHLKVWAGIFEHLEKGWMDGHMFTAYQIMLRQCDWATGVWRGCAEKLVIAMGHQWSESTAQRVLRRLADGRYITSHYERGAEGNYAIDINNYIPPCGENKGKKLRATKTVFWKEAKSSVTPVEPESEITSGFTEHHPCGHPPSPVILPSVMGDDYSRISSQDAALNQDQESSSREVSKSASQPPACLANGLANEDREEPKDELVLGHEDGLEDWRLLQQEETVVTPRGYKLDSESWHTGMEYYLSCFHLLPQDMAKPCHNEAGIWAFIECAVDLQQRLNWSEFEWETITEPAAYEGRTHMVKRQRRVRKSDLRHPIRDLVFWNRTHKTGGLQWACGTDLANAYWSDSHKSALAQWQAHDPDSCVQCRMRGGRSKTASADE